ncbi:MAG: sulfite exporter TauE/SafE family protein [Alkalispirochaeta sp.]
MSAIGFAPLDMAVLGIAAFLVGLRRGGVNGAAVLAVIILSSHFTAAASVGIGVLIFLYADVQATVLLVRDVDWPTLGRLLVPTVIGIAVAALIGQRLPTAVFEWVLFGIILLAYLGMILQRAGRTRAGERAVRRALPWYVTPVAGFLSGFTSMIGNLAGVFVAIYFAATGAMKAQFIATSVWFFFALNLIKLPIHIWGWKTLTAEMFPGTLVLVPLVTLGIWLGRVIVRRMSEETYRRFVIVVAGAAVLRYLYVLVT